MSTPVKPPGSGDPTAADAVKGADNPGDGFGETVERVNTAAPAEAANPIHQVAADLRAGRIDMDTAVDRLIEHTVRSGAGQALTDAGRVELRAFLRGALQSDPALNQLLSEMEG